MGMMDRLIGLAPRLGIAGGAAGNLVGALMPDTARKNEQEEQAYARVITQFGEEFTTHSCGPFDSFVNGINRLPRPLLTLSTLGLMGYAMIDPVSFSVRMAGLAQVPEPLWWLMGVIVSFYFGAREAHYARGRALAKSVEAIPPIPQRPPDPNRNTAAALARFPDNAALRDWAAATG